MSANPEQELKNTSELEQKASTQINDTAKDLNELSEKMKLLKKSSEIDQLRNEMKEMESRIKHDMNCQFNVLSKYMQQLIKISSNKQEIKTTDERPRRESDVIKALLFTNKSSKKKKKEDEYNPKQLWCNENKDKEFEINPTVFFISFKIYFR